ncbi:unnamed protein product [Soboliphyme baturini]|uniref:LIM zinc-binding domain-containing protein n=1 Tax=Soboliphyme baturini TaxID=241478 RepID=A0A183J0A5_9BILA|nr:unnamed protein product [Soboliphyme baturini]
MRINGGADFMTVCPQFKFLLPSTRVAIFVAVVRSVCLGIGGTKFISFEDRHWHNDCFICAQCETSLVGQGFITDGTDILCPDCAKARLTAQNA